MSAICYIVGASPDIGPLPIQPGPGDCIIAADGGYARLKERGLQPDVAVGDFDSLGFVPDGAHAYAKEKNDTDMMLAIRLGLQKGYRSFELYGGLGGRIDHTVANIQALLFLARRGARGTLVMRATRATVIQRDSIAFHTAGFGTLSIFSLDGESRGVTARGFKYPLVDATLTNEFPLGVSNEFIGEKSSVSVRDGTLLIIWEAKNTADAISPA